MDIELALTILESCAIGSRSPDQRIVEAMALVSAEIERLLSECERLRRLVGPSEMIEGDYV